MNPSINETGPNFSSGTSHGSVVDSFVKNHQMLEQALDGLIICLENVNGDITKITTADIITASDLPPYTAEYYYANAFNIMSDVHAAIKEIVKKVVEGSVSHHCTTEEATSLLLECLKEQPKMLKVISYSNDYLVWNLSLMPFAEQYATGWKKFDEKHWRFLYFSFCFLFMLVIKKWSAYNCNDECLPIYVNLIRELLTTNVIFNDTIAEWAH